MDHVYTSHSLVLLSRLGNRQYGLIDQNTRSLSLTVLHGADSREKGSRLKLQVAGYYNGRVELTGAFEFTHVQTLKSPFLLISDPMSMRQRSPEIALTKMLHPSNVHRSGEVLKLDLLQCMSKFIGGVGSSGHN